MNKQILIVDDEPNVRLAYRMTLETEGFTVLEANCGTKALEQFAENHFDLAILDMRMPEMDGLDLLAEMRQRGLSTPTVIITAYGDIPHAVRAMKLGAIDFLQKPITPSHLREIVAEMLLRRTVTETAATPAPSPDTVILLPMPLLFAKHAINCQKFDEARNYLDEALKQGDRPKEAHNLLGMIYQMQGDYVNAKRCFQQSLAIDSQYEPAQQNLRALLNLDSNRESTNKEGN